MATGNTDGIIMALDVVRNGGIIALKSMHGRSFPCDPSVSVNKELTM